MTDCANPEFRDELPDLLHGRLSASARARVEAHLRTCDACRREMDVLRSVLAAFPPPRVNVAAITGALPAPRRRPARSSHLWQIAAAVVFLAVGSSTAVTYMRHAARIDSTATATVASAGQSTGSSTGVRSGDVELSVGYGYRDLTDAQLEALLKDVQNLKAVPMAEPDLSTPNVTIGNGGL